MLPRSEASFGLVILAGILSTACTASLSSTGVEAAPASSAEPTPLIAVGAFSAASVGAQLPTIPSPPDPSQHALPTSKTSDLQGEDWQRAVDAVLRDVSTIDAGLSQAARSIDVEGEDATSGTWLITWSRPGGEVVKRREAWNGGCCSAAQIKDYYYRKGTLIQRVMWISPHDEMALVAKGLDPKSRVKVAYDEYDNSGRLLRTFVDNLLIGKATEPLF